MCDQPAIGLIFNLFFLLPVVGVDFKSQVFKESVKLTSALRTEIENIPGIEYQAEGF